MYTEDVYVSDNVSIESDTKDVYVSNILSIESDTNDYDNSHDYGISTRCCCWD